MELFQLAVSAGADCTEYDEEIQRVNIAKTSLMLKKAELERLSQSATAFQERMTRKMCIRDRDPSHVLLALGRPHEVAHGSLRRSLCEYNTQEEIDYILGVVPGIVAYLREMSPVWDELEKGQRPHLI